MSRSKTDILMEIILKNSEKILDSRDADAVTLKGEEETISLKHVDTWAFIIDSALRRYPHGTTAGDILRMCYFDKKGNQSVINALQISRQTYFHCKETIKAFLTAASCQCNIYHVINPVLARDFTIERSAGKVLPQSEKKD